jgi:hypothetical protein
MESRGRGVLDPPHARGMTNVFHVIPANAGTTRSFAVDYFSPSLNGSSLSGGTVCSAIANIIATMT